MTKEYINKILHMLSELDEIDVELKTISHNSSIKEIRMAAYDCRQKSISFKFTLWELLSVVKR